mgnify:CR=1 FL=1
MRLDESNNISNFILSFNDVVDQLQLIDIVAKYSQRTSIPNNDDNKLNYKFIIGETLSNNLNMACVLKFHGFKRIKTIKNFLLRNGRYLDKYNFNLSRENWLKQKKFHK